LIGDEAAIASAISDACTRERVNIINLSLGSSSQLSLLTKQISLAVSKYNVLVVAAAGNDGTDAITYPAAQPECLSVGAVAYDFENGQLQKTLFSDTNN
jgi:subtilisin family serine protease